MSNRTKRGHIQKDQVLEKLGVGRSGAVQVCTEAKINSDEYRAAGAVMTAIDDLAGELTGNRSVLWEEVRTAR